MLVRRVIGGERQPGEMTLFSAPLSGCSARVRIVALLKKVGLTIHTIDMANEEFKSPEYLDLNPNGSVPTLVIEHPRRRIVLTQSLAILEYLEQLFPSSTLFPPNCSIANRAHIWELASLIACDTQPLQRLSIRKELAELGADVPAFASRMISRGLNAYEALLEALESDIPKDVPLSRWSMRRLHRPTLADICLVPMVQGAIRNGIDVEQWPRIARITEHALSTPEFAEGGLGIEFKRNANR